MAGIGNLIHEVSTSTGTGNMTVTKVIRSFDEEFGASSDEDVFWYFAWNNDVAGEWEIGTGHKPDATTFVRDTVVASSNSDALVDWSSGTKHITNDLPAERQVDSASLGTAAATDASAYATAAQGAKADSAVQPGGALLPSVAADSMLVDNDAGTLRETKTFPQVRALLEVPKSSDLPWIIAADHGVVGDGTDQTTALQDLIDNIVPVEGGTVLLKGNVVFSALDLTGRKNIRFTGTGGNGTGSAQSTILQSNAGAIGAGVPAINAGKTFNVAFEKMTMHAANAAFNGVLLMYGAAAPVPGDDAALMSIDDVLMTMHASATSARMLWLYGATQGQFNRMTFSGPGIHVSMQDTNGVGFCNVHSFRNCNFKPRASQIPIRGSGEGITFLGCNTQASSGDGIGRFWLTSNNQDFRAVSILGCTFYDVTAPGAIWATFTRGEGLQIGGCIMGGADPSLGGNYGIQLGGAGTGVRGFDIRGNSFRYMTAAITFSGTSGAGTHAKKGVVGGNSVFGGSSPRSALVSGVSSVEEVIFLPNYINSGPNDFGSHMNLAYAPKYADRAAAVSAGLITGDMFVSTVSPYPVLTV